jgi:integrase
MTTSKETRWLPTKVTGIRKDRNSGIYYANKRVNRRYFGESLGTTDFFQAKAKFFQRVAELSAKPIAILSKAATIKLSLGALADLYLARLRNGVGDLDPKTIEKRAWLLRTIRRTWAAVPQMPDDLRDFNSAAPRRVSFDHLLAWRRYFLAPAADSEEYDQADAPGAGLSADYFNKSLQLMREVFALAIENGHCRENPAARVDAAKVQRDDYTLPTAEELQRILSFIGNGYRNQFTQDARDLIEGLLLTGMRIGEARQLRIGMVHLQSREIRLPAAICKGVKGKKLGRTIPILPEALGLFEHLVRDAGPEGYVFRAADATDTLKRACKRAGWAHKFSLHSLRHCFATRCLEGGVNVRLLAGWLGHRDGGKLLLTTYAHLCHQHGKEAAERLRFFKPVDKTAPVEEPVSPDTKAA